MSERRERSGLFKFFYVIIRIITFPIYMVLFILRHPIWVIFLLLVVAGAAYYYPTSQGVKTEELLDWYKNKLVDVQKEVVAQAEEKGMKDFVPKAVVDNVKQIEEEEKEKEREALEPKSDNYNRKVEYDEKTEETKLKLKKRGGFKKQTTADVPEENADNTQNNEGNEKETAAEPKDEVELLEKSGQQVGGLAAFVKSRNFEAEDEKVEENNSVPDEMAADNKPVENGDENVNAVVVEEEVVISNEPAEEEKSEAEPNETNDVSEKVEAVSEEIIQSSEEKPVANEEKSENASDASATAVQQSEPEVKEEPVLPTVEEKADAKEKDDDLELDFF